MILLFYCITAFLITLWLKLSWGLSISQDVNDLSVLFFLISEKPCIMYFFFEKMESCITRLIGRWIPAFCLHMFLILRFSSTQPQEDVLWVGHFPPELPGTCRQQAVPVPPWTDRDLSRRHVSLHLRQLQCHPSKVRGGWFYGCWTSTMGFLITILMIFYKMFIALIFGLYSLTVSYEYR